MSQEYFCVEVTPGNFICYSYHGYDQADTLYTNVYAPSDRSFFLNNNRPRFISIVSGDIQSKLKNNMDALKVYF